MAGVDPRDLHRPRRPGVYLQAVTPPAFEQRFLGRIDLQSAGKQVIRGIGERLIGFQLAVQMLKPQAAEQKVAIEFLHMRPLLRKSAYGKCAITVVRSNARRRPPEGHRASYESEICRRSRAPRA